MRLDGIALSLTGHVTKRKLYWAEANTNLVMRANLLGSRIEAVAGQDGALTWPRSVVVDAAAEEVVWAEYLGRIKKKKFTDGPTVEPVSVLASIGERSKVVEQELEVYSRLGSEYIFTIDDTVKLSGQTL